jgi:hypothetical protein
LLSCVFRCQWPLPHGTATSSTPGHWTWTQLSPCPVYAQVSGRHNSWLKARRRVLTSRNPAWNGQTEMGTGNVHRQPLGSMRRDTSGTAFHNASNTRLYLINKNCFNRVMISQPAPRAYILPRVPLDAVLLKISVIQGSRQITVYTV